MGKKVDKAAIDDLLNLLKKSGYSDDQFKLDADSLRHWGGDWSKHFSPDPSAIVFARSTEQVQSFVQACNLLGVAITPSGGRTGLSAGAVAAGGEVVLSLDKMNQVLAFYEADRMALVQAGTVTKALQEYAAERGLYYPVDFASSGSSQIGGNIGTNAGGIKVIRYGMTRNWVQGLTVVTGKGDILRLNKGMIKNATGYDLRHLFVGAEGTLGIVTEAHVAFTRPPKNLSVMVLGVDDFAHIMRILAVFRDAVDLTAFEFFDKTAMDKLLLANAVTRPFEADPPFYALLEFEAPYEAILEAAMAAFEMCAERGWIVDGVLSQNLAQAEQLWQLRERISETLAPFTPYKNDVSVLISRVPDFIQEIDAIVAAHYPDFEVCWFGHIGDGNLHLNILKPDGMDKQTFFEKCQSVNDCIFQTVQKYDGSVSAEHGVGMTKKPYLRYTRTPVEIEYMRQIKAVFDPNGVLNPGKIFD